jgi:hypothetical protein
MEKTQYETHLEQIMKSVEYSRKEQVTNVHGSHCIDVQGKLNRLISI